MDKPAPPLYISLKRGMQWEFVSQYESPKFEGVHLYVAYEPRQIAEIGANTMTDRVAGKEPRPTGDIEYTLHRGWNQDQPFRSA